MALQYVQPQQVGPYNENSDITFALPEGKWDFAESYLDLRLQVTDVTPAGTSPHPFTLAWPSRDDYNPVLGNTALIGGIHMVNAEQGTLVQERLCNVRASTTFPVNNNRQRNDGTSYRELTSGRFLQDTGIPQTNPMVDYNVHQPMRYKEGVFRLPLRRVTDFFKIKSYDTAVTGRSYITFTLGSVLPEPIISTLGCKAKDETNNTGGAESYNFLLFASEMSGISMGDDITIECKNDGTASSVDRTVTDIYRDGPYMKVVFNGNITQNPVATGKAVTDITCTYTNKLTGVDYEVVGSNLMLRPTEKPMQPVVRYLQTEVEQVNVGAALVGNATRVRHTFRTHANTTALVVATPNHPKAVHSDGQWTSYRFFVENQGINNRIYWRSPLWYDRLRLGLTAAHEVDNPLSTDDKLISYDIVNGDKKATRQGLLSDDRGIDDDVLLGSIITEPIPELPQELICTLEVDASGVATAERRFTRMILFKYVAQTVTFYKPSAST